VSRSGAKQSNRLENMKITRTLLVLLGSLLLATPVAQGQFSAQTLDVPNATDTYAQGISGSNVVGYYLDTNGTFHGFLYNGSNYSTLDDPTAATGPGLNVGTFAQGIDGTNVVGFYVGSDNMDHGFLFNGSSYTTLDDPRGAGGTTPFGISGANIVGSYSDNAEFPDVQGFLYNGGTYTPLGALSAQGISGGSIVGNYPPDTSGYSHGFLYNGSSYLTLGGPNGLGNTYALGISGSNIVGNDGYNSFLYDGNTYTTLYQLDAYDATYAQGIFGNTIVGYYTDGNHAKHGFITTVSSDHDFAVNVNNNTAAIAGYLGSNSDITVPATIDGIPVISIGDRAFAYSSLTNVTIPNSVTTIGASAFEFCGALTNVTIPASVTKIGVGALACPSLTNITVQVGNPLYSSVNGVLFYENQTTIIQCPAGLGGNYTIPNSVTNIGDEAFDGCFRLTSVAIPNSVTTIGDSAFTGSFLYTVTIPDNVTSIGDSAFNYCPLLRSVIIGSSVTNIGASSFEGTRITSVAIPKSVTCIGVDAFASCLELGAIAVDSSNATYSSVAGVLFNKSQTTIIQSPGALGGNYTIPNIVTSIGEDAFVANVGLSSVTIPSTVTNIGRGAFGGCTELSGVYFGGNAPSVGTGVFDGDQNATAYYQSGASGWGSVFGGIPTELWVPQSGSLQVTITPSAPVTAGAHWRLDGGAATDSGATVTNISVGVHTVSFTPVLGWNTPSNQMVTIASGLTKKATGVYTPEPKGNPNLIISSPKSAESVSNALLLITGTVSDKVAVYVVQYQLNGGGWTLATTSNSWSDWSASVALNSGANRISAYAEDTSRSFSSTNTVAFKFIPSATLALQINGNGTVTPNLNRKLLPIGANYTLRAVPSANNVFSNWVGGTTLPYAVLSTNASYTFTMESNLVLQADFVPNPFIVEQGTFNGLFLDTNDVTEASSGLFTLALMTSGAFTGKILTSGGAYSLPTTTPFGAAGQVQFTVPTEQTTLTFNLQLDLSDPSSDQITGTVSDGAWTAGLIADRAVFNAKTNQAVNYAGLYTLAIAGTEDAAVGPAGFGCATLSINTSGLIAMKGNLADGTAMSQSVSVSKDGRWPFYVAYPAPPAGNGGGVCGWLTFSNRPASALSGMLYWFRPEGKTPAVYQPGFTNTATVMGSSYYSADKPLLALTNGQVTLDGGNLPFTLTNQIILEPNGTITVSPPNTNKLALTISKTTGAISGSFANPSNPKQTVKINGVLLQNHTNAAGYFLGTSQSGAFLIEGF